MEGEHRHPDSSARDFSGEKQSQFLQTHQHFQPCCSISGQPRPAVGRVGHQAETSSPGMRHLLHPQQRDKCYGTNRAQGTRATWAAQTLTHPQKHVLAKVFKKDGFLPQVSVMGGPFSAAAAQGRAGHGLAEPGQPLTWLCHPFPAPAPAGTTSSSPRERKFSLQPALLTQRWAETSATLEGLLLLHRGDSDPASRPRQNPTRLLSQLVSHLIQGQHPGFHTSCKGNIPVCACRGCASPQVCFHGSPSPY